MLAPRKCSKCEAEIVFNVRSYDLAVMKKQAGRGRGCGTWQQLADDHYEDDY